MPPLLSDPQQSSQAPQPTDPTNSYYQQESDLTGGLPINLDSLRDGPPGTKPFYPYSTLIRYDMSVSRTALLAD
jgi:forkhead box protein J2/3